MPNTDSRRNVTPTRIKLMRYTHCQSVMKFSRILNIPKGTFRTYEDGNRNPRMDFLVSVGRALGSDWVMFILGLSDIVPNPIEEHLGKFTPKYNTWNLQWKNSSSATPLNSPSLGVKSMSHVSTSQPSSTVEIE